MATRPTPESVPDGTSSQASLVPQLEPEDLEAPSVMSFDIESTRGHAASESVTVTTKDGSSWTVDGFTAYEKKYMTFEALEMTLKMEKLERRADGTLTGTLRGAHYELRVVQVKPTTRMNWVPVAALKRRDCCDTTNGAGFPHTSTCPEVVARTMLGIPTSGLTGGSGMPGAHVPWSTTIATSGTVPVITVADDTDHDTDHDTDDTVQINFRATPMLKKRLNVAAAKQGVKLGELLNKLTREGLDELDLNDSYANNEEVLVFTAKVTKTPAAIEHEAMLELLRQLFGTQGYVVGKAYIDPELSPWDDDATGSPKTGSATSATSATKPKPSLIAGAGIAITDSGDDLTITAVTPSVIWPTVLCFECGSTKSGMHLVGCKNIPCDECGGLVGGHAATCSKAHCVHCGAMPGVEPEKHMSFCPKYIAPSPF